MIPNLWHSAKAVLRRKAIAIQAYLRQQENSQNNSLVFHLRDLEIEHRRKPRVSRRRGRPEWK